MSIFDIFNRKDNKNVNTDLINTKLNEIEQNVNLVKSHIETIDDNMLSSNTLIKRDYFYPATNLLEKKIINFVSYVKHFENSENSSDFKIPIVDFCRIERAYYFGDSLLRRRLTRYLEKTLNEGYYIYSKNDEVKNYIEKRIRYNEISTGVNFDELVKNIISDIIMYDWAVLGVKRSEEASPGYSWSNGINVYKPIYAFERLDIPTLLFSYKNGKYLSAIQIPELRLDYIPKRKGSLPIFNNQLSKYSSALFNLNKHLLASPQTENSTLININNIIMAFGPKPAAHAYPIPSAAIFIEDIQLLRDAEEALRETLFQLGFPLLHAKIGSDILPMKLGEDISLGERIRQMDKNAILITDHRVNIDQIIQRASSLSDDIKTIWQRVVVALELTDVALGVGSSTNKGTASVTDKVLIDVATRFQNQASELFNKLFEQFLYEAGVSPFKLNDNNKAILKFNNIDMEKQVLYENHVTQLYVQNVISHEETREMMHLPKDFNKKDLYAIKFGNVKNNAEALSNAVQPENQYKKKTSASTPTEN